MEGGLPIGSQCQLYFLRQLHFICAFHERVSKCRQSGGATFINLHKCFFTNEFYQCRQSGVATIIYLHYSRTSVYRRQSEFIIVICTFNAQYDPNFNV